MEDVKKRVDSSGDKGGEDDNRKEIFDKVGNKRIYHENNDRKSASPEHKDLSITKQAEAATSKETYNMGSDSKTSSSNQKEQNEKLKSARAEMGEVREENQRLKMYLDQITKEYRTLQMQFHDIIQKEERNKSTTHNNNNEPIEEPELVSLSLGRFSSEIKDQKEENVITDKLLSKSSQLGKDDNVDHEQDSKGLSLGLDCKFEATKSSTTTELPFAASNASPMNNSEEVKKEAGEKWPPGKALKTARSGDEEVLQQYPVKKARVSVRARCDTPTMNDGCQWRKYGQKIAKGNPCPRAYYRCTVAPTCPVRKQVQRCSEDMSILVTTYEGTHNHPLPISATAMASTTSAAASMLLSGSSSSSRASPSSFATTAAANLHGLNFYLSDHNSNSKQFYLHNSSLSPSPSHPTITLDLTSTPNSSSLFNRFSSSTYPPIPQFSSTSLNFTGSSESNWGGSSLFTYGSGGDGGGGNSATSQLPFTRNQLGTMNQARPALDNNILNYRSHVQRNNNVVSASPPPQQQLSIMPDTIAAATKAITADPSFHSALAAALQSIIGGGNVSTSGSCAAIGGSGGGGDGHVQKLMKLGESHFPVMMSGNYSSASSSSNGNACATSYLNRTASTSSHQGGGGGGGSLMFLPPSSLPISSPESTSTYPGDDRDHPS